MEQQLYNNPALWRFVEDNIKADVARLRLKYHGIRSCNLGFDADAAICQVECRQRFGKKLSRTLQAFPHFWFDNVLSGEQCSSDLTAAFHATLIEPGARVADLTTGLGIDALHLAAEARSLVAVEQQPGLTAALAYNAAGLGLPQLTPVTDNCAAWLEKCAPGALDVAFIDPARRAADGSRVYGVADCQPDVTTLMPLISRAAGKLEVKLSPMLDIAAVIQQMPCRVQTVYTVGTATECKELVAVCLTHEEPDAAQTEVCAVTLSNTAGYQRIQQTLTAEKNLSPTPTAMPVVGGVVYEPFPAVMKSGLMRTFAEQYGLTKLHDNTHVFVASAPVDNIPATAYRVAEVVPWQSKHIKRLRNRWPAAQVATRNFGITANALAAKLGVRSADSVRVLGVTGPQGQPLLLVLEGVTRG